MTRGRVPVFGFGTGRTAPGQQPAIGRIS